MIHPGAQYILGSDWNTASHCLGLTLCSFTQLKSLIENSRVINPEALNCVPLWEKDWSVPTHLVLLHATQCQNHPFVQYVCCALYATCLSIFRNHLEQQIHCQLAAIPACHVCLLSLKHFTQWGLMLAAPLQCVVIVTVYISYFRSLLLGLFSNKCHHGRTWHL